MFKGKALTKNVRIGPRKARLAADLIRGLPVEDAKLQLRYCNMKAGLLLLKTLNSAIANSENLHEEAKRENMRVLEIRIDEGRTLKRSKSRSRGSKVPVLKRTSHFTIIVGNKEGEE